MLLFQLVSNFQTKSCYCVFILLFTVKEFYRGIEGPCTAGVLPPFPALPGWQCRDAAAPLAVCGGHEDLHGQPEGLQFQNEKYTEAFLYQQC